MAGRSRGKKDVDARDKPGHDAEEVALKELYESRSRDEEKNSL
jgi:hypothetical protein